MDADVVVVGAGQAGLAASCELAAAGVEHVVLERGRVAETWRGRWDSFCLVTPNWSIRLPDWEPVPDADGFLPRDELVAAFERYAAALRAPVQEDTEVTSIVPRPGGGFHLTTSRGELEAGAVVLATGAFARPHRPPAAAALPDGVEQLDTAQYRAPDQLPPGRVLVVGSGQTGCQIAEELHLAGHDVVLACGKSPWVHRRIAERDIVWWLLESGFLDVPVERLPSPLARLAANVQATGRDGGHDLTYRELHAMGVTLAGRLDGVEDHTARFAPDLGASIAWGDARHGDVMAFVRALAEERGIGLDDVEEPEPFAPPAPESMDLRDTGAVVFACGYRPDHAAWVQAAGAFDELGFPLHRDGASTAVADLYFTGVHFLRTRKSGLLCGAGEDAKLVARAVADAARRSRAPRS